MSKTVTRTIVDFSEALEEAQAEKLITEKEADSIFEYMKSNDSGNYYETAWEDMSEDSGVEPEEVSAFQKFWKKYESYSYKRNSLNLVMFDCRVYN